MKYLLLAIMVLILSCQTKEDKAHAAIKEYLSKTLNDFKSYEPLEFGKIDSSESNYGDTDGYKALMEREEYYRKLMHETSDKAELAAINDKRKAIALYDESTGYAKKAKEYTTLLSDGLEKFHGTFNGYRIIHKFRAKNAMGALILNQKYFFLDKNMVCYKMSTGPTD